MILPHQRALQRVFSVPVYVLLAVTLSTGLFSVIAWLPNSSIILTIWLSNSATIADKLSILWSLYGSVASHYGIDAAIFMALFCSLFGIYVSVLAFYIQQSRRTGSGAAATPTSGYLGMFSAALGIGCAACGSLVATSLFTAVGAAGLLLALPFGGLEFGLVALALLVFAIDRLLRKIVAPLVC